MSAGANRFDPQISSDLTLVFAIVGERRVGDSQVENTGALITDQLQSRMTYDFAVCNINRIIIMLHCYRAESIGQ